MTSRYADVWIIMHKKNHLRPQMDMYFHQQSFAFQQSSCIHSHFHTQTQHDTLKRWRDDLTFLKFASWFLDLVFPVSINLPPNIDKTSHTCRVFAPHEYLCGVQRDGAPASGDSGCHTRMHAVDNTERLKPRPPFEPVVVV